MKIDRASLAVVAAVSKDSNRYAINGIYIGPDGTTVGTDGTFLIAVEPVKTSDTNEDAPVQPASEPLILEASVVKTALRALATKRNDPDSYGYVLKHPEHGSWYEIETHSGFRGQATQKFAVQKIEGNYPQYAGVIPKVNSSAVRVTLSAKKLEQICKAVTDARKGTCDDVGIDIYIQDHTKPVTIRAKIADDRRMTCVIMPVTKQNDSKDCNQELSRTPWESDYGKRAKDAYDAAQKDTLSRDDQLVAAAAD